VIGKRLRSGTAMTRWVTIGALVACLVAGAFAAGLHLAGGGHARTAQTTAHGPVPEPSTPAVDWTAFPDYQNAVPVLLYHSVGGKPSYLTTSTQLFAAQMRALSDGGFHPLTMQQYVAYVHGHSQDLPSRPILITFDDGRRDAYNAATPILAQYGFHATEFDIPGWIKAYPDFALPKADLVGMEDSPTWSVQLHFGYGKHTIQVGKHGAMGSVFGYLRYLPGKHGKHGEKGHLESFGHFKRRFKANMRYGMDRFGSIFHEKAIADAIPTSNYGQDATNDPRIPKYVLPWLDRHFQAVFGGDYLDQGKHRPDQIPGRFSPKLSYRMSMGPRETLPVFHCRLMSFVTNTSISDERRCFRLLTTASGSGNG
jgi:hypothetical protein